MIINLKQIIFLLKKYRLEAVLAPLFKMLEALFDLAVPLIVAGIINEGVASKDKASVLASFGVLILMAVLGIICSIAAQYFSAKAAVGISSELRRRIFEHIQSLSFSEIDKAGTSALINRLTDDVNQVQNGLNMFLRLFMRSPFIVFGSMIMAFRIDVGIALIFAWLIPILFAIVAVLMYIVGKLYAKRQGKLDDAVAATREGLEGVRVIRAFGREDDESAAAESINNNLAQLQLKAGRIGGLMNPLTYLAVNAGIVLILWQGGISVNTGKLLPGDVIALVSYISQILVELIKLTSLIVLIGKAVVSMKRIGEALKLKNSMSFGIITDTSDYPEAVRLENAGLKYSGSADKALFGINFSGRRGQTVGIIGGTGSGKSSLAGLIARFYDATEGNVYFMGKPIAEWSRETLRKKIAVVMQKTQLLSGTIRSNLLFGRSDARESDMWEALETAQAADFVRGKEGGLDSAVEQGGRNLSGGQRQRLSIARAVIAKPDILILDDSSSALDYATDRALRAALKRLPKEMLVIIISQRTSSIQHADVILVLDDGHLAGSGNHDYLLKNCDVYREIHESTSRKEAQ